MMLLCRRAWWFSLTTCTYLLAVVGESVVESDGTCSAAGSCGAALPHVVFQDFFHHTEGVGAKWRTVKWGLWMTLRVNQILRERGINATSAWLPNPAQMQNPQALIPSMMGGLGIMQSTAPPPVLGDKSKFSLAWLNEQVRLGVYKKMLKRIEKTPETPYAFYLDGPYDAMHWIGRQGAWLHTAFYTHRLARIRRTQGAAMRLPLPPGVSEGKFVISVHIRHFDMAYWNLSGEYFVACIRAIFANTPLSCDNSAVLVIGRTDTIAASKIQGSIECAQLLFRDVFEVRVERGPEMDPTKGDDYTPADDEDDGRRGFVFRDLEILGLSDFIITSHSEYSMIAMGLSSYDTITLCSPRRPDVNPDTDRRPPCDRLGVPNTILTHPTMWGRKAVRLNLLKEVDETHVAEELKRMWRSRVDRKRDSPVWSSEDQGIAGFDPLLPVEESWPADSLYETTSRPELEK